MADVPRPNILWITTHDISPDLGCYAEIWPGADLAFPLGTDSMGRDIAAMMAHGARATLLMGLGASADQGRQRVEELIRCPVLQKPFSLATLLHTVSAILAAAQPGKDLLEGNGNR